MTLKLDMFHIIHARTFQRAFRKGKAARLNDIAYDAKAGRRAQNRSNISGHIRLIKRNAHNELSRLSLDSPVSAQHMAQATMRVGMMIV
jgi:hypothetical protein